MKYVKINRAALVLLLSLTACAAPHQIKDRADYIAEGMRVYTGETRERLIAAAETVLKISDPTDFEFRYTGDGFTGLRRYMVYAVLAMTSGREKWEFHTEPLSGGIRGSVSISEAGVASGGYTSTPYEGAMMSVPLYRLFWARVDYMLGKRPDWITCDEAIERERAVNTNVAEALSGLCGVTSNGRDAPPPPPLPNVYKR